MCRVQWSKKMGFRAEAMYRVDWDWCCAHRKGAGYNDNKCYCSFCCSKYIKQCNSKYNTNPYTSPIPNTQSPSNLQSQLNLGHNLSTLHMSTPNSIQDPSRLHNMRCSPTVVSFIIPLRQPHRISLLPCDSNVRLAHIPMHLPPFKTFLQRSNLSVMLPADVLEQPIKIVPLLPYKPVFQSS